MQDRFRIDWLRLVDFRCFSDFELELHPESTLLVGPNGHGKSAIIDGLAAACGRLIFGLEGPSLRESDVRVEVVGAEEGPERRPRPRAMIHARARLAGAAREIQVVQYPNRASNGLAGAPRHAPPRPMPVLARYGADRLVSGEARRDDRAHPDLSSWWNPATAWSDLVTWFRRETLADLQHSTRGPALRAVRSAVTSCLADLGITDLYYDVRTEDLRVIAGDVDVPFELASGGAKSLVALVVDLAARTVLANPDLGELAPRESPGLVMIDEVELHLHPRWQRMLLPALRRTFPCLQLVASTHSPQVVGSVAAASVRIVSPTGATGVDRTWGRDTNTLLEDVFGDPGREPEIADSLRELFLAIDLKDPAAAARLSAVEGELGADDPDVARARFMLEMGF